MQIVINAGGNGTRLWPISTKNLPKQFCKILEDKTLLETTFERVRQAFSVDNIWVNTNHKHRELVKELLPELPDKHILTEPERRDTFPAVVSHAAVVASHTTRQEPIIFLSSDHYIAPQESIDMHNQALRLIEDTLRQNMYDILVAGVHPNYPSSRFGYIQIDKQDQDKLAYQAVDVQSFREKPSMEVAEKYLEAGNYLWNFGAFAFDFNSLLKNVQPILPQAVEPLEKIYKEGEIKLENFRQLPKTSFDYAVLEHTQKLGVVGMNVQTWDDIGGVDSLYQYLSEAAKHEEQPQKSNVIQIDAKGNRVQTHDPRKKYALVGVSDLVVVETPEGLLIADPKKAGEVKKASQYFEEE